MAVQLIKNFDSQRFQVDQEKFWETLEDPNFCMQEIVPHLFLGNQRAAGHVLGRPAQIEAERQELYQNLKSKNITHILCLTSEKFFSDEDFHYLVLKIDDVADQVLPLKEGVEFIDRAIENQQGVLVHCAAGQSRSASFVIAYLMQKYKISYEHALAFVQSKRACALPNEGFARQLKQLSP